MNFCNHKSFHQILPIILLNSVCTMLEIYSYIFLSLQQPNGLDSSILLFYKGENCRSELPRVLSKESGQAGIQTQVLALQHHTKSRLVSFRSGSRLVTPPAVSAGPKGVLSFGRVAFLLFLLGMESEEHPYSLSPWRGGLVLQDYCWKSPTFLLPVTCQRARKYT